MEHPNYYHPLVCALARGCLLTLLFIFNGVRDCFAIHQLIYFATNLASLYGIPAFAGMTGRRKTDTSVVTEIYQHNREKIQAE